MLNSIPTYVLVVRELPERTEYVVNHLKQHNVNHKLFHGFPGVLMGLATNKAYDIDGHQDQSCLCGCGGQVSYKCNPGTVACTLSHLALFKHIVAAEHKATLILESDVEVPQGFEQKFNELYKELPDDWDLVYLDWAGGSEQARHYSPSLSLIESGSMLTNAYLVSLKAARFLDEHCQKAYRPIDVSIMLEARGHLKTYFATPKIASQLTSTGRMDGSLHFGPEKFKPNSKPPENTFLFMRDSTTWDWVRYGTKPGENK